MSASLAALLVPSLSFAELLLGAAETVESSMKRTDF